MARFFVIDQSLDGLGGHHFDTVRLISRAAASRNFEVIAATNRKFDVDKLELSDVKTLPVFRNSTYTPLSQLGALRETTRSHFPHLDAGGAGKSALMRRVVRRWQYRRLAKGQNTLISEFAQDCQRLFEDYSLGEDDHVLFMTVNELDFMGLAAYLANDPNTVQARWNVVFHFGIFSGRPSFYGKQRRQLDHIRHAIQSGLARIPYHQISFLASTEELVEQYNQLRVGNFQMLPYPIDPAIAADEPEQRVDEPIRLTLAGGLRREKGKKEINRVARGISVLRKEGANVRLTLQKRKRKWFQGPDISLDLSQAEIDSLIHFERHPLPADDYRQLINRTDIGLLLYENRTYYARRAGVLCEYLTAGRPVVVPAGCWLSHQIAEPTFRYIDSLIQQRATGAAVGLEHLSHSKDNVPFEGGVLSFDRDAHPFEIEGPLPEPCAALALQFDWHWPEIQGTYVKAKFTALDASQNEISKDAQIIGHRDELGTPNALFRVPENTTHFAIELANAFDANNASIKNFCLTPIGSPGDQIPRGSVGFAFTDYDDVAQAVSEVINNYSHYAKTAAKFAKFWARLHDPGYTVDFLVGRSQALRHAA